MGFNRIVLVVLLTTVLFYTFINTPVWAEAGVDEKELTKRIQEIYDCRAGALITGATAKHIPGLYDLSSKYARWALDHEQNRINFMQTWAEKRGVKFTDIKAKVVVKNLRTTDNSAKFTVHQTMDLTYQYPGQKNVDRFRVGMIHWVELVNKEGKWLIRKEYYTDALGDDTLVYRPQPDDGPADVGVPRPVRSRVSATVDKKVYDRRGAVAYADKYACKYNKKYQNLNGIGGDCTNFVSQCLGDKEGGKIPMDGTWYSRGGNGSLAWVRTVSFAQWLTYCGRASKLTKGTFQELNQPNDKYRAGAIRELAPGDLIGYEEKGRIQHFAIITGFDSKGYPLVNAHTTDRFHCPWDMGWDKKTVFHLYKMKD